MANDIKNFLENVTGLKQDFRVEWKEDTRGDWRADWKNSPKPAQEPSITTLTADMVFSLAAADAGKAINLAVVAADGNTPALPLTYQWSMHTGHALNLAPIQTPTAATASTVVPSTIGVWTIEVVVSNGQLDVTGYVKITVNA
jgi:hypothetical protein